MRIYGHYNENGRVHFLNNGDYQFRTVVGGRPARETMYEAKLPSPLPDSIADQISRDVYEPVDAVMPTSHLPGTMGKVRVMAHRIARGESLWHPDDAKWTDDDREFESYLMQLEELKHADSSDLPREAI